MNIIINTIPASASLVQMPERSKIAGYGEYLVNAAGCKDCHTPFEGGQLVEEMAFAGGREFPLPGGQKIISGNITPDEETGIGGWTKERFIERFVMYRDYTPHAVGQGDFNTVMPWIMYAGMSEEDIAAIFEYLKTLKPVRN